MSTSVGAMLDQFLIDHAWTKFGWRQSNCGHFIAAWLMAVERVDYLQSLSFNMPRDAASAARLALRKGGLHCVVSEAIRRPTMQGTLAQVGDIVLLRAGSATAGVLAVCNGRSAMALSGEIGTVAVDMSLAQYAWRIDRYVE